MTVFRVFRHVFFFKVCVLFFIFPPVFIRQRVVCTSPSPPLELGREEEEGGGPQVRTSNISYTWYASYREERSRNRPLKSHDVG